MLARFRKFFQPPTFDNLEKNIRARNIHAVLLSTIVLTVLFLLYGIFFPPPGQVIIAIAALLMEIGMLVLIRGGNIGAVSAVFTTVLWIAIVIDVALYGGIRDTGFAAFAIVIIIASLTMGARGSFFYTAVTLLAGGVLVYAENQKLLPAYVQVTLPSILLLYGITFISVSLLLYLVIRSITMVAQKAMEEERELKRINISLEENRLTLQNYTQLLERRNAALETIAEITRIASKNPEESVLVNQMATLIADRLGLHHIGIFLLDMPGEYLVLHASNSQEGQTLIESRYQLRAVQLSRSRGYREVEEILIFKVGEEIYHVVKPAPLIDTLTNISLPLSSGSRLLGMINIQHTEALSAEDSGFIQTIADQAAVLLENVHLLAQLQTRLQEIDHLAGRTVQTSWRQVRASKPLGYAYDRLQVLPSSEHFPPEAARQLLARQVATYVSTGAIPAAHLVAPIVIRDEVIGTIGYENADPRYQWAADEIAMLETIAAQIGLALENNRLIVEAQQRVLRERMIGEVSSRMRETLDIDTVLRTAVRELQQSLGLKEAEVKLQPVEKVKEAD